jgi:hypothetical protein
MNDIYKREPIEIRQNINIFSELDEYTKYYEVISKNIESSDSNPSNPLIRSIGIVEN